MSGVNRDLSRGAFSRTLTRQLTSAANRGGCTLNKTIFGAAMLGALALSAPTFAATKSAPTTAHLEAQHPAMRQLLRYSDRGKWVMTLQADLNDLGVNSGPVDGIFGPKTEAGVRAFQRSHNLPVSGVTYPATWQDILAGFGLVPPFSGHATAAARAASGTIDGYPILHVYHMIATAYGPSLADNYPYGPTDAFGQHLQPGMIAVDPSVIPLKSRVYVTGYKDGYLPRGGFLGRAMDTGGAIKGMRIDVFMNDNPHIVSNFGVQPVKVYVLGK